MDSIPSPQTILTMHDKLTMAMLPAGVKNSQDYDSRYFLFWYQFFGVNCLGQQNPFIAELLKVLCWLSSCFWVRQTAIMFLGEANSHHVFGWGKQPSCFWVRQTVIIFLGEANSHLVFGLGKQPSCFWVRQTAIMFLGEANSHHIFGWGKQSSYFWVRQTAILFLGEANSHLVFGWGKQLSCLVGWGKQPSCFWVRQTALQVPNSCLPHPKKHEGFCNLVKNNKKKFATFHVLWKEQSPCFLSGYAQNLV